MSAGNTTETNILKVIFTNTTWAGLGDTTGVVGSSGAGSLYISLHTGDPGETGDQTTSEAAYTSYARVAVARTTGGWTVSGNTVSNAAAITFPACTGSSATCTHFGVGKVILASGAGELLFSGALTSPSSISVTTGITPSFAIGALTVTAE